MNGKLLSRLRALEKIQPPPVAERKITIRFVNGDGSFAGYWTFKYGKVVELPHEASAPSSQNYYR